MSEPKGVIETVSDGIRSWPLLSVCLAALAGYAGAAYYDKKSATVASCVLEHTSHDSNQMQIRSAWKACGEIYGSPTQK